VGDNAATSTTRRADYDNLIVKGFANGSGTDTLQIQFKNYTADGWTHTYVTNTSTAVYRIYYQAIGGDDIKLAKVGTINAPSDPEAVGTTQVDKTGDITRYNFLTTRSAAVQRDAAIEVLSAKDHLIFHCGVGATPSQTYIDAMNAVTKVPNSNKGIEVFSLADMQANIPIAQAQGWAFMVYDLEGATGLGPSPDAELDDPVGAFVQARAYCDAAGLKLHAAPEYDQSNNNTWIDGIAAQVHWYHLQGQRMTDDDATGTLMDNWVRGRITRIKNSNPTIEGTSYQVSLSREPYPGSDIMTNLKWVIDKISSNTGADGPDGIAVWWNSIHWDNGNHKALVIYHDTKYGGLSFVPDVVLFATTGAGATLNTHVAGARLAMGFATSQAQQACISNASRSGVVNSSSVGRRISLNRAVSLLDITTDPTVPALEGEYMGPPTGGNGFGIKWHTISTALGGVSVPLFYLAIKGSNWDIRASEFPTAIGTQSVTTGKPGFEFTPKGLMFFSANNGNTIPLTTTAEPRSASATHWRLSIGAAQSTTVRNVTFMGEQHAVTPTITARASDLASVLQIRTPDAIGANSALLRSADITGIGATGFTLNHTTVDPANANVKFLTLAVGDTSTTTLVEKELVAKYHIRMFVQKDLLALYSMGGRVTSDPIEHEYDILGYVEKELIAPYHILNFVEKELIAPYKMFSPIVGFVDKDLIAKYHIRQFVDKELTALYNVGEDPTLNLRRYEQGYGLRVYIMSPRMDEVYHMFNSFDHEDSTIGINACTVDHDAGSAPECHFAIEDSAHIIDTSQVGEGNVIAVQAAKTQSELGDGDHNLFLGYVKHLDGIREDTNNLVYEFTAYGTKIRFNERLTSMNRTAKRIKFDSPEPDSRDPDMIAWKLFDNLVTGTDHLPFGGPRETKFTTRGIIRPGNRVENFIAQIDEELTEWSSVADDLAERSTAEWDVDPENDVFFRYPSLHPSGVVIKDKIDRENDDPYNTCYIRGPWRWSNSIDKEDGFTNRFAAIVGQKSSRANVKEVDAVADQFTSLAIDEPPTDTESGKPLPEGYRVGVGPFIWIRGDLIGPNSPVWASIANMQREFNYNVFYVVLKVGSGTDGPGSPPGNPDWVNPINDMVDARCLLLGYIDTQDGNKSDAAVRSEIDRWYDLYGPYGIVFDNAAVSSSTAAYYNGLAGYALQRGFRRVWANAKRAVSEENVASCPNIWGFIIREGTGLPTSESVKQSWFGKYQLNQRALISYGITTSIATDDDIGTWVMDMFLDSVASHLYVTNDNTPQPFDTLSGRIRPMLYAMERAAVLSMQNSGYIVPGVPVEQDVAMSFIAETNKTDDIALVLSKIGDVSPVHSGQSATYIYGEILSNRQVIRNVEDPNTGAITTELLDMPDHTNPPSPVSQFWIKLSQIEDRRPTVIFLHGITRSKAAIVPQRRYWVVLYGRGRNSLNTIRWHHAQGSEQLEIDRNYRVAIRVPRSHRYSKDPYHVYTSATHPGLALSYFRNTTNLLDASDPDSIEKFQLVESKIEFPHITDEMMVSRTLQSILNFSAKPKRIYDINEITVPNKLLFPGMLVTIVDEMAGFGSAVAGGSSDTGTEAELLSVSYKWDASQDIDCKFLTINAVGHVDFQWQYWYGKYVRGEISFDTPDMPAIPQTPKSPTEQNPSAPLVFVTPRSGTFPTGTSVKFSSNKESVLIMYTRNGTIPADTQTGSTLMYIPNESPPVKVTSSTWLRYKAIDRFTGLQSMVYASYYNVGGTSSPSPTPSPPPPPSSTPVGSKILWVLYRQEVDRQTTHDTYTPFLNRAIDGATLQKPDDQAINSAYESNVLNTATKFQDIEFQTISDMENNIAVLRDKGYEIVTYAYNADFVSSTERKDPVAAHQKFASIVRKKGLKVRFNPEIKTAKTYASRLVRYCDYYNMQVHELQHDQENFRNYVKKTAASLRSNNTNIVITITLSAQHQAQKGLTLQETLRARWAYAKQHVDGVRVYFANTNQLIYTVSPFLTWFVNNGRLL